MKTITTPPSIKQELLIDLLKQRNQKGFTLLYDRYAKVLYHISLQIVHDPFLAQDVLQDSFVKIYIHIEQYDPSKGTLFTWLLNITRHTAIDTIRSRAYKQSFSSESVATHWQGIDQREWIEPQISEIQIKPYLLALPSTQQVVLEYVYRKGYSHQETALALQLPLGTVKSRIKAALGKLRTWLM